MVRSSPYISKVVTKVDPGPIPRTTLMRASRVIMDCATGQVEEDWEDAAIGHRTFWIHAASKRNWANSLLSSYAGLPAGNYPAATQWKLCTVRGSFHCRDICPDTVSPANGKSERHNQNSDLDARRTPFHQEEPGGAYVNGPSSTSLAVCSLFAVVLPLFHPCP